MKRYHYDDQFVAVRKGTRGFFKTSVVDDLTTICDNRLPVASNALEAYNILTGAHGPSGPCILRTTPTITPNVRIHKVSDVIKYVKSVDQIIVEEQSCVEIIFVGNSKKRYRFVFNKDMNLMYLYSFEDKEIETNHSLFKPSIPVISGAKVVKMYQNSNFEKDRWKPNLGRLTVSYYETG